MTGPTQHQTGKPPRPGIPGVDRRHRWSDFYHERTNFQFIKHSRRWAILSGAFMVVSIIAVFTSGLNFGIEFEGGTSWQVPVAAGRDPSVPEVRDILDPLGLGDAKVTTLSGSSGRSINVQERVVEDPIRNISDALATYAGIVPAEVQFDRGTKGDGTFTFTAKGDVTPTEAGVKAALAKTELKNPTVVVKGKNVTVSATVLPASTIEKVATALARYAGSNPEDVSISTVGPTWGRDVSQKALKALIYFFILLALYLSIRFESKMALASITAVVHDIIFTIGVYAIFGFAVTPATITAFLTILGFSLYDTVVVFDKVKENERTLTSSGRATYGEMVNRSLNEVLWRSLSTSFVALMPVLSLLIVGSGVFGAKSLEDFALALAAGLFIGSYSSLFVAAPLLAWFKEREPKYRALKEKRDRAIAAGASASAAPSVAAGGGGAIVSDAGLDDEPVEQAPVSIGVPGGPPPMAPIQPRARQQRRRKRK